MKTSLFLWAFASHLLFAHPADNTSHDVDLKLSNIVDRATSTWRVQGQSVSGFRNSAGLNNYINSLMKSFMRDNPVTQAQINIVKGGKQLLNRAYIWDYSDRATTQVTDTFLLASISKMYLCAAVQTLINNPKSIIKPGLKVYKALGYKQAKDPRIFDIQVQHLLDHKGGDNREVSGDPPYNMRNIALQMSGGRRPATARDVIESKMQQYLDYPPGGQFSAYSNYGYLLLSYLVQNVTKSPYYYTFLSEQVLKPNKLDVKQWLTNSKYHIHDNVKQLDPNYGPSALEPLRKDFVPYVYGGDGMFKDISMGSAALAASAATLTRTAAKSSVSGWKGGRAAGYVREGSTPGARTRVESRYRDGLDVAIVLNTRNFPDSQFGMLQQRINSYLDVNGPIL